MFLSFIEPTTIETRSKDLVDMARTRNIVCEARFSNLDLDITLPSYTLRWPLSGQFELSVDDVRCVLDEKHFLITNPGQRVTAMRRADDQVHVLIAIIARDSMKRAFLAIRQVAQRLLRGRSGVRDWPVQFDNLPRTHSRRITPLLREIQRAVSLDIGDVGWLDRQVYTLCERLLFNEHKHLTEPSGKLPLAPHLPAARLNQARLFIEEHYARQITVADAADKACMSPHHFLREFKRQFGETPHRYLRRKRLDIACDMLGNSTLTMSEIAERVGFRSVNGFHRAFRQQFGHPPSQLRSIIE